MESKIVDDASELYSDTKKTISNYLNLHNDKAKIYLLLSLFIIAVLIFFVISWIFNTLSKKDNACKKLNKIYLDNSPNRTTSFFTQQGGLHSTENNNSQNYFDNENKCLMKNYYIKTAYNACCGDGYKNNFVNICALEKCIKLGARCLDFEIYSYNGEPIVAASTANDNSIKETYNYIKLTDLFEFLKHNSFNTEFTQCANDPMFLHFRIMSTNSVIYDKFGEYIENNLIDYNNLLNNIKYNYKNNDRDRFLLSHIGNNEFHKKFIIMVNAPNTVILENSTKLSKYIHIRSGSDVLKLYRYQHIVAAGSNNRLMIDDSQRNLIMVLPDINNKLENFDPLLPLNNGCQFVGMKFQNLDNNLVGYYRMFNDKGNHSFVLKPNNLRRDIIPAQDVAADSPLVTTEHSTLFPSGGTL